MAKQIGIDFGTSNTMIWLREANKIVLSAPTVITLDRATRRVVAIGKKARDMLGKTPPSLHAIRPLKNAAISDTGVAALLLHEFLERLDMTSFFSRPSALISIPDGFTEVERQALEGAAFEAGIRNVRLVEGPLMAALGAGVRVGRSHGAMVVDLGGGVTEAAVLNAGGIVHSELTRTAGDAFDTAIARYIRSTYSLQIGEVSAELLKRRIGSAIPSADRGKARVSGLDVLHHKAKEIEVSSKDIRNAIRDPLETIFSMVSHALEQTPPELSADLFDSGIVLTGGGALLPGLAELMQERIGIKVRVAPKPLHSVILGIGQRMTVRSAPPSAPVPPQSAVGRTPH